MKFILLGTYLIGLYLEVVEGTCGLVDTIPEQMAVPSDFPTTVPFWEGRAFGAAFAAFRDQISCPFTTSLSGTGDNQTLKLYVKEEYKFFWDNWRGDSDANYGISLRCADGSIFYILNIYFEPYDVTPTAPYFSSPQYTYSVSLPWPISIPITVEWPIWVRERDYNSTMAQVAISVDMPNIVNVRTTNYSDFEAKDFKVDLYLNSEAPIIAGTYQIILTADDNFNVSTVPVTLYISEATCKATAQIPTFGNIGSPINFYKAIVSSLPSLGDILDLNGQTIEATHPDPVCQIDLSVDSDFLEVNSKAEVVFSRSLSIEEIEKIGISYVVQISAVEKTTGTKHQVPLFICIEVPEVSAKPRLLHHDDYNDKYII